jgi:hypothetical protein
MGTRRLPSVTAMVQNPPTLMPNITRAASITAKFEASAEVMLEATSSPVQSQHQDAAINPPGADRHQRCGKRRDQTGNGDHEPHFRPVVLIDSTNWRWKTKKRTSVGAATTTEAAII